MPEQRACGECGAAVPDSAPQGLCPRCLVALGLALSPGSDRASSSAENEQSESRRNAPFSESSDSSKSRRFGDYELLGEIARGGMGIVYRARQISLGRVVAVKVLLFGKFASDDFVRRFRAEAEAAASLKHPNVVAIHEIGEHEGHQYFSMDYIEGQNLAELTRYNPLPARTAARYLKTIAEAIQYAHGRGILHRDLKPSNVLIDRLGQPYITDFGLAKQINGDPNLTATGQLLGSPNYMPPEQAQAKRRPLGPSSDVYSLGAILYHLLTGRAPFMAETLEDTLFQLLHTGTRPVAPRLLNPSVPRDLETICLKSIEKDPRRRYPTAQSLADDLGRYMRNEPIAARPENPGQKVLRWCRREPVVAGLVAAITLVIALGFSGVFFEWRRSEKERRRAEKEHQIAEAKTQEIRQGAYVTDMNLALRSWREGNTLQAFQLIQTHRPEPGQGDLRGFEWRHLAWLCRGDYEFALPEHKQVVGAVRFSPNGELLATYAWNNTLTVWRLDSTGANILTVTNASTLGGFSPNGEQFIAGRRDGTVMLCNLATGNMIEALSKGGELVAVAANGDRIATIAQNGELHIHDLGAKRTVFRLPSQVHRRLDYTWDSGIAFAPDGNTLAVVEQSDIPTHEDRGVRLWDIVGSKERPFLSDARQIRCLQFSPDGKVLAVGGGDGTVKLWDVGTPQSSSFKAHDLPVLSIAFSPDGETLATGSSDQTIKLWDAGSMTEKPRKLQGQLGQTWSLAFSPDGKRIASGSRDTTVKIWNFNQEETSEVASDLYSKEWGNFTFSADSKLMAAGCRNDTVRIWDVETLHEKGRLPGATFAVAFSSDGKTLLTSSRNEAPQWWDLETKAVKPVPGYKSRMQGSVACVALSPDRRIAALGFKGGSIQLLEIDSGKEIASFEAHPGGVGSLDFSPTGDKLVSGGRDKSVAIWDVQTQALLRTSPEHRGTVCAVAFSHDGKMIASGCNANTLKFWDAADINKSLASMSYHGSVIRTLCFAPDGKTLASGSEDNKVKLWNVGTYKEIGSFACNDHVRMVLFSPDGNNLAIITDNGTLRLLRAVPPDAGTFAGLK